MTREEAVELFNSEIKNFKRLDYSPKEAVQEYIDAMEMAIKALEREPKWIPVSERLPEEGKDVLTQAIFKDDIKMCVSSRVDYNYWTGWRTRYINIVAWMPLPEPYKAESEVEKCR